MQPKASSSLPPPLCLLGGGSSSQEGRHQRARLGAGSPELWSTGFPGTKGLRPAKEEHNGAIPVWCQGTVGLAWCQKGPQLPFRPLGLGRRAGG